MGKAKIRVGLVGIGNWALRGHLPMLALLPDYQITAVQARRPEAAQAAAARFDLPHVAGTVEELVARPDVDLVAILTTAPQHGDGVRAALAAGKHVYSEWPLTTDPAKAEALAALAEASDRRHFVGLQRRLAPATRYLGDLLADGYVGNLRSVRLHVSMNYFQRRLPNALRWTVPPENFSSVVAIYAGHFLDALFAATGWPDSVTGLLVNQFQAVTIIETGETLPTTNPDQLVIAGRLGNPGRGGGPGRGGEVGTAVLSVHIEGGKRSNSGVRIDITGDRGDLTVTNRSAFGEVGDDYLIQGAQGDDQPLAVLPVPAAYHGSPASGLFRPDLSSPGLSSPGLPSPGLPSPGLPSPGLPSPGLPSPGLPSAGLPSSVLELGHLYAAIARDLTEGTHSAPDFRDAVRMHRLLAQLAQSSETGRHLPVERD